MTLTAAQLSTLKAYIEANPTWIAYSGHFPLELKLEVLIRVARDQIHAVAGFRSEHGTVLNDPFRGHGRLSVAPPKFDARSVKE